MKASRRRAQRVLKGAPQVYGGAVFSGAVFSEQRIREQDHRQLRTLRSNVERNDRFMRDLLAEVLRGSRWQLIGPVLVVLGIILGTWANVASLS